MMKWLDRRFDYRPPPGEYPMIVERLRGTPARVADRIRYRPAALLTRRDGSAWSIQEHIGHLLDLEALWSVRVDDFLRGAKELTAADMSNRKTYEANHNARAIESIAAGFQVARQTLVDRLDTASDPACTSFHPRLQRPMRLIDLCFFVAEHDDHHLAIVSRLLAGERGPD
jgi:uncharacterized damage-inducible protein DinB